MAITDLDLNFGIDLSTIVDRLLGLGYFVLVEDLQEAAVTIENETAVPPAAFVGVASETAELNKLIGGRAQRVTCRISILFVEMLSRADGALVDTIEQTRKAIIRQLVGFTPGRALSALEYERYQPRAQGDGLFWGEVIFVTSYRYTAS